MSIEEKYKSYQEQLEVLTENMDKYQYLINIGSKNSMPEEYKLDSFKVHGCMSQVWLVPKYNEGKIIQIDVDNLNFEKNKIDFNKITTIIDPLIKSK